MGFNLVRLAIHIRTDDVARLVTMIALSGNRFAELYKTMTCEFSDCECDRCSHQDSCSWHALFGQKLSVDTAALKRHQKPPLPFIFSFPMTQFLPGKNYECLCDLVVIGSAIPHLGMLLTCFAEMLVHGLDQVSALVIGVFCRDFQGNIQQSHGTTVKYSGHTHLLPDNLVIASSDDIVENSTWTSSEMCIRLLSPLKLVEDGRTVTRFDFARFARSVMRRVSSLAYYYGECELEWDFKEMSRLIDDVICTEQQFRFTTTPVRKLSGITGHGSYLGDFGRLAPLLLLGTYVHAGKGATYGMGAYDISS